MKEYKYKEIELTPNIFSELMIKLFDGKQFRRKECIEAITRYHKDKGGLLEKNNYVPTFKKASEQLREKGLGLTNVSNSVWRLNYKKTNTVLTKSKKTSVRIKVDKEIGKGKNTIYVYYYDCYKKMANLLKKDRWECKIGKSSNDAISRVINQTGTCYPEPPHIALVIRCDNATNLESAIHSVLSFRRQKMVHSPGNEWFITNPKEIEKIYYSILK